MNKDNYQTLADFASLSLQLSFEYIQQHYSEHEIYATNFTKNKVKHKIIEVRFDNYDATMNFFFQKQETCDLVSICFDNKEDEEQFIDFLNETTQYDYIKKQWKVFQCFASTDFSDGFHAFVFYQNQDVLK